jgi:hypothetical protein
MNIYTTRQENNVIELKLSQTDRDCLSQDFTMERNRAQLELARAANKNHKLLVSITTVLLFGVFAIGFLMLVFQIVKVLLL